MSSSTPTTTPTRKGGDKGFFKKIRFRRSSSGSGSSSSNSKKDKKMATTPTKNKLKNKMKSKTKTKEVQVSNSATVDDEPILLTRRVIKATRPPSPTTAIHSMVSSSDQGTVDTSLSSSGDDRERPQLLGKDENLREKTEQFRMDRLENAAAIRKENKEKEIMQHRLGVGKSTDEDDAAAGTAGGEGSEKNKVVEMEVSEIFKTQTFHPEHKRKVSSDDHTETEKKTKLDDSEETSAFTSDGDKPRAVVQKTWKTAVSGWITAVAPATVVAACAFMMMRVMRKR